MDVTEEVLSTLDHVLSLRGRALSFTRSSMLLGAIPELDSMAVVSVIAGLEERFGITVDDDDLDGQTFESVGTLCEFVEGKLAA
jgi:acyl carrier protein